jgi:tRNA-Thr(GGU) m(6)t(6)A37 methyltransferase TsaA
MSTYALSPIGFVRSANRSKFSTRHQPDEQADEQNRVELEAGQNFEAALKDLAGFTRIWLISWFHKSNGAWRTTVLPPRGLAQRRGVFATRSPHRPNALALTTVQLRSVSGRTLTIGPCDLVDGTPVFDIKPYIPEYDSFPHERAGWTEAVSESMRQPAAYAAHFSRLATEQANWLAAEWKIDFRARLVQLLERDPSPHRTRRIRLIEGNRRSIACGAWLAVFTVTDKVVEIEALGAGYPERFLTHDDAPDREAQLKFLQQWPSL